MRTGNRVVDDLVHHVHLRCSRIIGDSADLLETDEERLLFILSVLGHIMAEAANGIVGDGEPGPAQKISPENMMMAAMVLVLMVDREGLVRFDLGKALFRAKYMVDRIKAATP